MTYRIVPRTDIGLPPVATNMNGSKRPLLQPGRTGVTIHYVGSGSFKGKKAKQQILNVEAWARSPQKKTPDEYNYVIAQDNDDLVYEYAGARRAAHSGGNNSSWYGILLLNGTKEPPTERQIDKVRWLRQQLISEGRVKQGGETRPHRKMPKANTSCPGDLIMARFSEMLLPWEGGATTAPAKKPPAKPTPTTDGYGRHLVRVGDTAESVSKLHFGTISRAGEIAAANGEGLIPGQRCKVHGFDGAFVSVAAGWGPWSIIEAAGFKPSAKGVERFWVWNGGDPANGERGPLVENESVWVEG